jgi:DNA-binding MarR family transcriptional regulator
MASLEPFDLSAAPGHLIRRAQQLHTALWSEHVSTSYTSLQFAALAASAGLPELDQTRLGELVGADRSTIAEVVRRLCGRGLLERRRSVDDARRNELRVTPEGVAVLRDLQPRVVALGEILSAPLDEGERVELRRLLTKLVTSPGPR